MKLEIKDIDDKTWSIIYDGVEVQKLSKSSVHDFDNCFCVRNAKDAVDCLVELIDYNIHHQTVVVKDPEWHTKPWEYFIQGVLTKEEINYFYEVAKKEY